MSSHQMMELRPDRSLLNPDFDRYLLANRSPEVRKLPLKSVKECSLHPEQFGYEHSRLFADVERLVLDPFLQHEDHLYYFTADLSVAKVVYKPKLSNSSFAGVVATVPAADPQKPAFPPSLIFPDKDFAVVANGAGLLLVYSTGERSENKPWQLVFSMAIDETTENKPDSPTAIPFVLADVRSTDRNQLSLLAHLVLKREEGAGDDRKRRPFFSRLVWLDCDLNVRAVARRREVVCYGNLELATLNFNATQLITLATEQPSFTFDSLLPVPQPAAPTEERMDTSDPAGPGYVWRQDAEEISVQFELAQPAQKHDVVYSLRENRVHLQVRGEDLLNGSLEGPVHHDSSVWTLDGKTLTLTLFKVRGHFWKELIPGDSRGRHEANSEANADPAIQSLEKFTSDKEALPANDAEQSSFNPDQLEEVDAAPDQPGLLHWTDGSTHTLLQCADLSGAQLLFRTRLQPGGPRTLCTRLEHDGIVWSLDEVDLAPDQPIAHKFTLNAFGYVQASHSSKLGSNCSPDGGFAFVVHPDHHVFVYVQSVPVGSDLQLRNRSTGRVAHNVSEQVIVNAAPVLGSNERSTILGHCVSNSVVYLLTPAAVLCCEARSSASV